MKTQKIIFSLLIVVMLFISVALPVAADTVLICDDYGNCQIVGQTYNDNYYNDGSISNNNYGHRFYNSYEASFMHSTEKLILDLLIIIVCFAFGAVLFIRGDKFHVEPAIFVGSLVMFLSIGTLIGKIISLVFII